MTKDSYKHGFDAKRRARSYIMSLIKGMPNIIGLAGPSIAQYYHWCKQQGFVDITSYEYDNVIINRQRVMRHYYDLDMEIRSGSIFKAPVKPYTFYDIDLCNTLKRDENCDIVAKFGKLPMMLTVCTRKVGTELTVNKFFEVLGIKKSKPLVIGGMPLGLGRVFLQAYNTDEGNYLVLPYKDHHSPQMLTISKIN